MFCIPMRLWPSFPPTSFFHTRRRGSSVILMAETGDGTQGLAKKSTPVSNPLLPHGEKGEVGRPEAHNGRRNAGASAWVRGRPRPRGAFLGAIRGLLHSRARLPPHPPDPLLPQGEKGESGLPEAQNEKRNAGACQKIYPCEHH